MPSEKIDTRDFYKDSRALYLGTYQPYDRNNKAWYGINFPVEFNWLVESLAGSMKSKLIQTMLPFFYAHDYYICIIEAKGCDYTMSLDTIHNVNRLHPKAYSTSLPVYTMLPSYLDAKTLSDMNKVDKKLLKKIDEKVTIQSASLTDMNEWIRLFKSSESGAEVLHSINIACKGNIKQMIKQIHKGIYFDEGKAISINVHTKNQLLRKLILFNKNDEFLNAEGCNEINFNVPWGGAVRKIVTIPMMQRRSEYMSLYAKQIIDAQMRFSAKMKAQGKNIKILNIWDDCQIFLDRQSDKNNPGKESIKESIRAGRDKGFNNIFVIQDNGDFTFEIMNGCTEFFVGVVNSTKDLPLHSDAKELIEQNRRNFREIPLPNGYSIKYVAYTHIPRNPINLITFFPADPNCGGY